MLRFSGLAAALVLAACSGGGDPAAPAPQPAPPVQTAGDAPLTAGLTGGLTPGGGEAALTQTRWTLERFAGERVTATQGPGTPAFLQFEPQGRLAGSTGCNRFSGFYARSGGSLRLVPGAMTKMACMTPSGPDEPAMLAMFERTREARIEGGRLTLSDGASDLSVWVRAPR